MAIKRLIAIATAGSGVKVVFQGNQAKTNGEVIYMPAMITPEAETLAIGYAWHESFHIQWTDFSEAQDRMDELKARPMIKQLENALEDGRIEREAKVEYPGTHRVIDELIASLRDQDGSLFGEPPAQVDPANALSGFVLNWTRKEVNGYSAIHYLDQWRAALAGHIGQDLVVTIEDILDRNRMLGSTSEAFDVATEIVDLIQDPPEESDDSDDSGDSEAGDDGDGQDGDQNSQEDDSDGSGGSSGQEDSDGEDEADSGSSDDTSGDSGDSSDSGDSDDEDGSDDGKQDSQGQGDGDSDADDQDSQGSGSEASDGDQEESDDRAKAREAINNASEDELEPTDLGDVAAEAINEAQDNADQSTGGNGAGAGCVNSVELPTGWPDQGLYQEVAASAGALGTRLRGIIQAETLVQDRHAKRSGKRLDRRKLVRVGLDDPRIFKRPDVQIDTSGHVHVLLDTSGSMNTLMAMLRRVGLATVRAIESVDELSVSASTLPTANGNIRMLKVAQESTTAVSGRFAELQDAGGTPIAESIEAVEPVLKAPVANRLLIIFTDGMPNAPHAVEQTVSRLAREDGVLSGGVILGDAPNALEEMMPCERIESLADLPITVTNLCAALMRHKIRGAA